MSEEIFKNRPVEADTVVLGTAYAEYDGIPVMIENWKWDGITASSCIVLLDKLREAGMKPKAFVKILKDKLEIKGATTGKESRGFLLNFNFES